MTRRTSDHRSAFRDLRNYLAGQHVGSTRDESLLDEALKALLCRTYLDAGRASTSGSIPQQYRRAWQAVRRDLPNAFANHDLALNDEALNHVSDLFNSVDLDSPAYDPFGDLYEIFMGDVAKGQAGQFFTPPNAVNLLVDIVDPQPGEVVLDPACGAGGFLAATARRWINSGIDSRYASKCLVGIDKDRYLANLTRVRLALLLAKATDVYCADSLSWNGGPDLPSRRVFGTVDVILTNPPFGSRIVAASTSTQRTFDLGHQWRVDRETGKWLRKPTLRRSVPPQVLFVERALSLLRKGGRLGIVVPESLVSSKSHRYVMAFLAEQASVEAVVGMPESLFKVSGSGGTHTKTCLVVARKLENGQNVRPPIFMAEVKWCGNDSRGRRIFEDELPIVADRWKHRYSESSPCDHLGYMVPTHRLVDGILSPRYYSPEVLSELEALATTHDLVSIQQLIDDGILVVSTGDEVGKQAYGTGTIPFVRTSDLSNWEIKLDPKQGVSEQIYQLYAPKQDVREGDILMVRDGTYLIGTCAYVTGYDTRIVYQSHLLKLRVLDKDRLSPFLLLASLSSAPVRRQIVAKRFTQDIIDSLGDRLREIVLPIPRDEALKARVTRDVTKAIRDRMEARELARRACRDIVGGAADPEELNGVTRQGGS